MKDNESKRYLYSSAEAYKNAVFEANPELVMEAEIKFMKLKLIKTVCEININMGNDD